MVLLRVASAAIRRHGDRRRRETEKGEWQFCTARISNYIKRKDKSDFVAVGIGQERLEKCYLATVGLMRMCSGFSAARESAFLATSSSLYLPLSETDDTEKGGDGRHGERRSAVRFVSGAISEKFGAENKGFGDDLRLARKHGFWAKNFAEKNSPL